MILDKAVTEDFKRCRPVKRMTNTSEGPIEDGDNNSHGSDLDGVDQKDCWLGLEVGSTTMETEQQ